MTEGERPVEEMTEEEIREEILAHLEALWQRS